MWRLINFFKLHHSQKKNLYTFSLVVLLFSIVDGIVIFYLPIAAEKILPSMAWVGIILASSSVWDIVADFYFSLRAKEVEHKALIKAAFFIALILLIINLLPLTSHKLLGIGVLLVSMIFWGFYYEGMIWGIYDYVIDLIEKKSQAFSFGIIEVTRSLAYTIAPVIAGATIVNGFQPTLLTGIFFTMIGLFMFISFAKTYREPKPNKLTIKISAEKEFKIWLKIGKKIWPILLATFSLGVYNGVVFSFTPILVEAKEGFAMLGGFIVSGFWLPTFLLSGWFGRLADRHGRQWFIFVGSLIVFFSMIFFGGLNNPWIAFLLSLSAGFGISMLNPALDVEFSDYIKDNNGQEKETIGEMGVSTNLGFIFGAALGGIFFSWTGSFWLSYFFVAVSFLVSGLYFFASNLGARKLFR